MWLEWRRQRLLRRTTGPLHEYLSHPLPARRSDYRSVEYLALDFETTGLDPRRDQILSMGYVVLRGTVIDLASACHRVVRVDRPIPEASAAIHQITDDEAARGLSPHAALEELLRALAGRVMIAHHARIERQFLANACKNLWGQSPPLLTVDTQALAHRTLARRQIPFRAGDLRLYALCERYNLPTLDAHDAFQDALSAAELFLAQAAYQDSGAGLRLSDLLC